MKIALSTLLLLVSASAFASYTVKVRVTCYDADGSGKAAIVQAVTIKEGILTGVNVDRTNPNKPIFKPVFTALADGCYVEAQTDDMPGLSVK